MSLTRLQFLQRLGLAAGAAAGVRLGAQARPADLPAWPPAVPAGDDAAYWAAVRAQYAFDPRLAYLNSGGLGPSPRPVLDIRDLTARALQHRVESGHFFFEEARGLVAGFLGASPEEVCFTRNATEGNSIIAAGLGLRAGDEVVFETHAHPGGSLPWLNQARQAGIVVRTFEPDPTSPEGNVERVAALLGPRTRAVQVSHITAPTGIVLPVAALAALCRERGVWFHVDGAQSAGMIPVDLRAIGCDSYAASGHKWLGGPRETGVLFIRRERIEEVRPLHLGAYSSGEFDFSGQLVYADGVRRHEYGTRDAASVVALAEATRFQREIGPERIAARNAALADAVIFGLRQLPGVSVLTPARADLRAAMVTFGVEGRTGAQVFGALFEADRLRCRPVSEAGIEGVRVSLHVFNTPQEADRLLTALRRLVAT